MNVRKASVSSRSAWWTLVLVFGIAGPARAQQDFTVPPTLLIPNYDRVYPGLLEALEGGAVVARARAAPALFYNPAGIALSDRTVLNASAQGYQLTTISGSGFQQSSGGAFETLPSFLGVVLGKEVIDWERVRLGFAVVHPIHSNLTALASTTPAEGQRASYATHSTFDTFTPTFSVGWAVAPSFRVGGSIEFPYTSLSSTGELSGEITTATTSHSTLRTLATTGSALHVVATVGVQWDALSWLKLGALVRTPGLNIKSGGSMQYEALTVAAGTRQVFFQDPGMEFQYKLPLEAVLGAALEFGPFAIEVNVKWHDGTETYPLYQSTKTLRVVDTTSGTPVISELGFPTVSYRARQLWNGSIGAHYAITQNFIISAGSYLDYSPVDPAVGHAFRRVDVVGFRAGVSFRIDKLAASVGGGWEHGTGSDNLFPPAGLPIPEEASNLTLNTFTLLFSVSFRF